MLIEDAICSIVYSICPSVYTSLHCGWFDFSQFSCHSSVSVYFLKGRGLIRPQIGPTTFSRRKDLETIQLDKFQLDEHSDAVFDAFDGIFNGRYGSPFYSALVYIFTSYLASSSTISQRKQNTCS
jgi:hypothetical protein